MAITVNKKSGSVSFNFYTTQRCGPKNRILTWNLFWDYGSVALAPLLYGMSEEQEKLCGVQFSSVQLRMFFLFKKFIFFKYLQNVT